MHCLDHEFDIFGIDMLMNAVSEVKNVALTFTVTFEHALYFFSNFTF